MAKAAQRASRYCLGFTVAGLRPDLAAVIAPSTWQRGGLERQHLQLLLAKGTSDERSAMGWLVNQVSRVNPLGRLASIKLAGEGN
ncbi:hypothetical protein [Synechococcus sp. CBW1108]|uniref:hypothetical protein n=1 Tax=Synechococcus sp. CBW1108 TaxID=1353147 RepID=UPI0018CFC788|nr:hypothetical protein [Synechococcus sp. CBW1108]QPN69933.1 hypothetical protein H8F27_16105 [Synechococcus sp. CBW1108]